MARFRRRWGSTSSVLVVVVVVVVVLVASCTGGPSCVLPAAIELCRSLLDCQNVSFNSEFLPKKSLLNDVRVFPTATAPDLCDGMVEKACRNGIGVRASVRQHCTHTVFASRLTIERDSPGRRLMAAYGSVAARRDHIMQQLLFRQGPRQARSIAAPVRRDYYQHSRNVSPNVNNYAYNSSGPHGLLYI